MPINLRRCVSCRQIAPKEVFWRVVREHQQGTILLDQGMGRSVYLCPRQSCLKMAQQKNRLGRALKAPIPEDIYEILLSRLATERSP
jgi:predicted RNA-binding protein YlxR (DUF448 family)